MSIDNRKYFKLLADYEKHCIRIAQATSINIHETPEEKLKRMKWLEGDYGRWFEYYFPNYAKSKCAWFHIELANQIIKNKRIRIIAEWFRSAAKSVHIDLGIPLHLYLAKSDLKFMLLIGENEKKANQLLSGIQAELQHNNRLKNDYGQKFQQGDWAEGDFTTTDGVKFTAIGFGQSPRGAREGAERPDYIVPDDIDNRRHVNNDRLMREGVEYLTEDVWGTFDSSENSRERFVYANNNFHKNSITNRLKLYFLQILQKRKERKEKSSTVYKVITVNAVKDLVSFTPEWPEKTTAKYWKEKYEDMPKRAFMREYMNTHVEEGKIFKFDDIQFSKPLALKQYDALCFYGDLSYKAQADYKALILVGKKGREFHILLSYVRQKSRADCAAWLYDVYEKYKLQNHAINYIIEGLFAMDEFVNDFDTEGDKRGYYIPVAASKRGKENKYDRIESMSGFFERRNVFFNELVKVNADQQELISQLLAFEKGSNAHDDGPDALHGAFSILNAYTVPKGHQYAFGQRVNHHY
ncbi:phage terminase large subunit [Niabella insulamsoli]|uniref:phage terminase large subunit n=1 Tax=Niabella insulamsoli TaxID=3144874 RepID=UPI0031FD8FC6